MMIPSSLPGIVARTYKRPPRWFRHAVPPPTLSGILIPEVMLHIAYHCDANTRNRLVRVNSFYHALVVPLLYEQVSLTNKSLSAFHGDPAQSVSSSSSLSPPAQERSSRRHLLALTKAINVRPHTACSTHLARDVSRRFTGLDIVRVHLDLGPGSDILCRPMEGTQVAVAEGDTGFCHILENLSAKELVLLANRFDPETSLIHIRPELRGGLAATIRNGVERLTIVIPDKPPSAALKFRKELRVDEASPEPPAVAWDGRRRLPPPPIMKMSELSLGESSPKKAIAPGKNRLVLGGRGGAAQAQYTASSEELWLLLMELVQKKMDAEVYYVGEELVVAGYPVDETIMATEIAQINEGLRAITDNVDEVAVKVVLKGYREYVADGCRQDVEGI